MTFKDKPKRPGGKPSPRNAGPKSGEKPAKALVKTEASDVAEGDSKAERISKVMARAGVASRRDIERMIMDGRVKLNGKLLDSPVVNVTLADKIEVDGVPIRGIERTRLWLYHKPAGLVTTNVDPEGRPTVFDNLPDDLPRVMSIGRLDINTEGLLLLTNDGGLARALELPTTGWLRRYRVRAHGEIDQEALDKLKDGIAVDGVLYGSIEATLDRTQGSNVWLTMGLREGKNREIKNVLGALGLDVNRLIRISYGPFQLGDLPERDVVEVRGRTLRDQLGPRLIEDAKANFDAPIYNSPAVAADEEVEAKPERRERSWKPEDKRERALSRLDTKRDDRRDDRRDGGRKEDDRPKRPALGSRRNANVWMAPGARPLGEKAAAKAEKNAQTALRRGEKPGRSKPQPTRYDDTGPRVQINRARDDEGEWIRSSEVTSKDEGGRKRSGNRPGGDRTERGDRSYGDRPPRGDRPAGDRPSRGDRPFGDGPRGDRKPREEGAERPRSYGDRPARSDRPYGDRPARSDRPSGDRPARGDRPFGAKPRADRKPRGDRRPRAEGDERPRTKSFSGETRSERPAGDRPFGDKPRGKSFGGKPGGGKNFSGKPKGDRPGGGKPSGGPSRGGPKGKGMTRGADRRR
ncbi:MULTISPECIES: pseudouridine synthase [Rhizobium]|uniref:Pseudouridine synthase n=1 Tax=Rhizobium favelukesii TaxID=348824 RepID=W6RD70_9HYPH|nr:MULTISPECIES: pseudouridine synthase [Rhizobium]MCS0458175.1 pseudouridine synthase [Rhizobium favelukesii]UFS81726.1 pseudouridine synthase [Rhizobium sp. T136]CDM56623.1 ribosomal large subunit pseudouridine synthase B [Rhizobium favelukesii]